MKLNDFLQTWEGTAAENRWARIFQAVLLAIVMFLAYEVVTEDRVVVIAPFTLAEEAWVTSHKSSQSYKEAWGYAMALLLGNVTPQSVDFIKERVGPLLSPRIYADVIDAIEGQALEIKNDRVTFRFEPREVQYELLSNKVFVHGMSFRRGAGNREKREQRTYEYIIEIGNYAPMIQSLDTYKGKPRTLAVLEVMEQKQKDKEGK